MLEIGLDTLSTAVAATAAVVVGTVTSDCVEGVVFTTVFSFSSLVDSPPVLAASAVAVLDFLG